MSVFSVIREYEEDSLSSQNSSHRVRVQRFHFLWCVILTESIVYNMYGSEFGSVGRRSAD